MHIIRARIIRVIATLSQRYYNTLDTSSPRCTTFLCSLSTARRFSGRRCITASSLPLHHGVTVISMSDDGIIALNKPKGILSHPNSSKDHDKALLICSYNPLTETYTYNGLTIWLLHRLDEGTSGVILLSTCENISKTIKQMFANRQVFKTYLALVFGSVNKRSVEHEVWTDEMTIKGVRRSAVTQVEYDHKCMSIFAYFPPVVLLRLYPKTGFTNQLRRQCAMRGLPIVGDRLFGNFDLNKEFTRVNGKAVNGNSVNRMFLHSHTIRLDCNGRMFEAVAPPPSCFGVRT